MPIRTVPFDSISEEHVLQMISRGVREDHTLDFKQELNLGESGKLDLLGDVTAMANASGGTILYGAIEGDDDTTSGTIVGLRPVASLGVSLSETIDNLLRDNVSERLMGVRHAPIAVSGGFLYVIRTRPSPIAPHLITKPSSRNRLFLRGSVSNQPMNGRQIREVALRSENAYDRAERRIAERITVIGEASSRRSQNIGAEKLASDGSQFIALHLIPLFPPIWRN